MLKLMVNGMNENGTVNVKVDDNGTLKKLSEFAGREFILVPFRQIEPVAGPVNWTWNDGQGSRGRQPRCLVISPAGDVYRFRGSSIEGVVKVLGADYRKSGKWSNSTYRCISPAGTVHISWSQHWETGATFPQDSWEEAFAWLLNQGPQANFESFEAVVRQEFPVTAEKFDKNREAFKSFS